MKTITTIALAILPLLAASCQSGTAGFYTLQNAPAMTPAERSVSHANIRAIEDEGFSYRHRERMSEAAAWRYARPSAYYYY